MRTPRPIGDLPWSEEYPSVRVSWYYRNARLDHLLCNNKKIEKTCQRRYLLAGWSFLAVAGAKTPGGFADRLTMKCSILCYFFCFGS